MFKIGDKVLIKLLNEEGEIISESIVLNNYFVKTSNYAYWCDGSALEIVDNKTKTNKISYNDGQSVLSWKLIDKNNLKIKIHSGKLNLVTFFKILVSEIDELKEFNYRRVSPYQVNWERPADREDKCHVFTIVFIDVKDNNKVKESEIVKLDNSLSLTEGEYNFFIPDLLELGRARGFVDLEEDTYRYRTSKFNTELNIKYLDDSMSREKLELNGWTVPNGYKETEFLYV